MDAFDPRGPRGQGAPDLEKENREKQLQRDAG